MTKNKISKARMLWLELSDIQRNEARKQLIHAGWKDEKQYGHITFIVNADGSIYGWNDPKWAQEIGVKMFSV